MTDARKRTCLTFGNSKMPAESVAHHSSRVAWLQILISCGYPKDPTSNFVGNLASKKALSGCSLDLAVRGQWCSIRWRVSWAVASGPRLPIQATLNLNPAPDTPQPAHSAPIDCRHSVSVPGLATHGGCVGVHRMKLHTLLNLDSMRLPCVSVYQTPLIKPTMSSP